MTDLKGKWVFITGASRGIGMELAKFMSGHGCNIILHARKKSNLESINKYLTEQGSQTHLVEAVLSDPVQIQVMLAEIDALGMSVDIVFNNAGFQVGYRENYLETPYEDYSESFKVNTIAPMMICYHFLPKMMANNFGRIVNTTSGIDKEAEQAGYSASKAALDKVTKDIAFKLEGTDVTINLFDPGWCRTDLGGQSAPNDVLSTLPGSALGAFVSSEFNGQLISGQMYSGLELREALDILS